MHGETFVKNIKKIKIMDYITTPNFWTVIYIKM